MAQEISDSSTTKNAGQVSLQRQNQSPNTDNAHIKVLHFSLPGLRLFIHLEQVIRVLPMVALTPVPRAPAFLKGLINISGQSYPVIDLAERIGHSEEIHYTVDTPILFCSNGTKTAGLIVDGVAGVEEIDSTDLQMQPLFDPSDTPVLGVVNDHNELSLSLDLGRILAFDLKDPVIDRRSRDRPQTVIKGNPENK